MNKYMIIRSDNKSISPPMSKHEAIIKAMKEEADADKERMDYLQSLNILLQQAIKDLRHDLGIVA